jgi:predicted MPP superfamily phosphohydrolase
LRTHLQSSARAGSLVTFVWTLSALLHSYVGVRLVPAIGGWPVAAALLLGLLAASAVALPLGFRTIRRRAGRAAQAVHWAGMVGLGMFSSLLVLTVLRDAGLLVARMLEWLWPAAVGFDALVVGSAAAVPVLGVTVTAWGFVNARRTARVARVDIPIAGLPPGLHGFTIVQLSDVHVGATIRRESVEAIVDAVNALQADAVAITGDLVDGSVAELAPHVAPLRRLASRHGTYFVTGNHEYYSGVQPWIVELRRLGIRVLMNEHVVIRHGEAALVLAGVADWSARHFEPTHRSDPAAALAGAPREAGARVLLAHQPRSAAAAADVGFDLQLSGHTHGGQFLPWTFFVRLQQPFTAGLHRLRRTWVYVSRGTGYWGPPKRFGAPSEITRIRLVTAAR